jgi:hypothetical protein
MTTNSQQKYKLALVWCEQNRYRLPSRCKFKLMASDKLYAMLDGFGVVWSVKHQLWYIPEPKTAPITQVQKQGDWRGSNSDGKAIIRIIAHKDKIDHRVAEFTELCEALNWHIVKVGAKYNQLDGDWQRQMITIQVVEDGD